MLHDRLDRDYLYVANKEDGLTIWNIQNIENPIMVDQITKTELSNLDVMNLTQQGDYLYLAIGNTFNNSTDLSGMAIVNVSDPLNSFVEDIYTLPNSEGGSGIVEVEGDFAYLGAMENGLIILDISIKSDIQFVSQIIPQINWPDTNQDSLKVNARGLAVRNDIVYLCYDAGGFRIIDASQKTNPVEIGRYSNPVMNGLPRAYNNITIDGNLAYLAVDYCGLEIVDFSNPSNIQLIGWWNPYNCPTNNWFTCPVHANEISLNKNCKQIFLSTGKSDMMVIDVSNTSSPDSCNYFGGVSNNIGTWGLDVYENKIFLSYVCTFGIPFASNWSGFKSITFNSCTLSNKELEIQNENFGPNPVRNYFYFSNEIGSYNLCSYDGKIINKNQTKIDVFNKRIDFTNLKNGIYLLSYPSNNQLKTIRIIKE
ncbi:MAG: T9SS type A sorting domain-containing protein [Flavobacteriia bacterium]|nr:T9SS type A sorting domain-containing protein [Flavobacteriia bacterium]